MRFIALLLALLIAIPAYAQDRGTEPDRVVLKLLADRDAGVPGETIRLGIRQLIAPGWHTYWTNPGDSGEAMRVTWALPNGYNASDLLWPAPEQVPYGPLMNFGYTEQAVMLADLPIPADAEAGTTIPLRAHVQVLVCDEICIPESHDVSLDLPIAAKSTPANADVFKTAGSQLPQPVDWPTVTQVDAQEVRVRITLPSYAAATLGAMAAEIAWFPTEWGYTENAAPQTASFEPTTGTLTLRQQRVQARDLGEVASAGYVIRAGREAFLVRGGIVQAGGPVLGPDVDAGPAQSDLPLMALLALAFIGGIILNLMPCVFPVLSMKALHLVSLPRSERSHARNSAACYAAGVVVMFLGLGALMLALRAAGEQLGWGFQLQNPPVVACLAWLMFVVGLNLSGVFDLRIAFGGEMLLAERHHPLLASFLTGVLATLVATPCSAPFMATAMGAALTQSWPGALLIFAFVGLGLAAPFVLLCLVPALQKLLPRPGAWMETFRQLLAFPMFASSIWLVWVVAQQGGAAAVGWTLSGMLSLAFAIWLLGRQPATAVARTSLMVAGILLIGLTLAGLTLVVQTTAMQESAGDTHIAPFTPQTLDDALAQTQAPVFVNLTASWCITCLVNEKATLDTAELRDLFATHGVTYLRGDWTNRDPEITAYLQKFRRTGVPLYVFYPSPDVQGVRPPPIVLPQILSVAAFEDVLAR